MSVTDTTLFVCKATNYVLSITTSGSYGQTGWYKVNLSSNGNNIVYPAAFGNYVACSTTSDAQTKSTYAPEKLFYTVES